MRSSRFLSSTWLCLEFGVHPLTLRPCAKQNFYHSCLFTLFLSSPCETVLYFLKRLSFTNEELVCVFVFFPLSGQILCYSNLLLKIYSLKLFYNPTSLLNLKMTSASNSLSLLVTLHLIIYPMLIVIRLLLQGCSLRFKWIIKIHHGTSYFVGISCFHSVLQIHSVPLLPDRLHACFQVWTPRRGSSAVSFCKV